MLRNNKIAGFIGAANGKRKGAWSWAAPLSFVPLALALALAGCAQTQDQKPAAAVETPATSTASLAAALPAPPSAEFDRPPVIPASLPGGAVAARPKLTGLDRASVIDALGQPRMSRREAAAEVLTFSGLECSLFVFLYDGPDGTGIVRHVEARARQGFALVSETRCIDSVLGRKAAAPANPV